MKTRELHKHKHSFELQLSEHTHRNSLPWERAAAEKSPHCRSLYPQSHPWRDNLSLGRLHQPVTWKVEIQQVLIVLYHYHHFTSCSVLRHFMCSLNFLNWEISVVSEQPPFSSFILETLRKLYSTYLQWYYDELSKSYLRLDERTKKQNKKKTFML